MLNVVGEDSAYFKIKVVRFLEGSQKLGVVLASGDAEWPLVHCLNPRGQHSLVFCLEEQNYSSLSLGGLMLTDPSVSRSKFHSRTWS